MIGKTKLTNKHKEILRDLVNYTCELCKKNQEEVGTLQIHRVIRGHKGGTYKPSNIKVLCKKCHIRIHSGEFK